MQPEHSENLSIVVISQLRPAAPQLRSVGTTLPPISAQECHFRVSPMKFYKAPIRRIQFSPRGKISEPKTPQLLILEKDFEYCNNGEEIGVLHERRQCTPRICVVLTMLQRRWE